MCISLWQYLSVLPVLHTPIWWRPINKQRMRFIFSFLFVLILYIEKHATCQRDYILILILRIWHASGDLCKYLGMHSNTDPEGLSVLYISCKLSTFVNFETLRISGCCFENSDGLRNSFLGFNVLHSDSN